MEHKIAPDTIARTIVLALALIILGIAIYALGV